jgi:DNA-binding MarR family transcriptional regulator
MDSLVIQETNELPDQGIYYSVLAELGDAVEKDYSPARHHVKIDSASKDEIYSLVEQGYLETKTNKRIELVTLSEEEEELASEIACYVDENYSSAEEFREEYSFDDVERLRDITLDHLV